MLTPRYELLGEQPIRSYRVDVGGYVFITPAVALPRAGGPRSVYAERVSAAARGRGAPRRLASRLRVARAPIIEVVVDASLGFEEGVVEELGRVAAEACPQRSHCLPPVAVGGPPGLYERLLRGYWEAGGAGVSLPLWHPEAWGRLLDAWDGRGLVVCEAGRRGWRSLEEQASTLRGLVEAPVYVLNYYRGGPVPRPAHELLFFRYGFDVLGYTRPTLRQLRALRVEEGRVRGRRPVGLDPERPVYVEGGAPFEEVAERLLERLLEEALAEAAAPSATPA